MIKALAILILVILLAAPAIAQQCGLSKRTLLIDQAPAKVSYQLYYAVPKKDSVAELDNSTIGDFLREKLGDTTRRGNFWMGDTISVEPSVADNFLTGYTESDFRFIYEARWREHHFDQLKGETANGRIVFRTLETDFIPFLLRLQAAGRPDTYLLSTFLGGCYSRDETETIKLAEPKKQ